MSKTNKKLKIFAVSQFLPLPDHNAGERRFCEILSQLTGCHSVSFFAINSLEAGEIRDTAFKRLQAMGISKIWEGRRLLPKVLLKERFDLLFAEFFYSGEASIAPFRQANPGAGVIVDSVDLHYAREEAGAKIGLVSMDTVAATRRREIDAYRQADVVINVTKEDDEIFRRDVPGVPSLLVPIITPVRPRARMDREALLFFVGAFTHQPNMDGLLWFANEAWPAIKRAVPAARFEIAGKNPPPEIKLLGELDGISILGYVPDTNPYLDKAQVSVAPLRFGAGMKGKVTEALASGVPVVTTSIGAQGFGATDKVHLRIADDGGGFAQAVIDVLKDNAEAYDMGLRGQALVAALCSPKAVEKAIDESIELAVQKSRAGSPLNRAQFAVGAMMEFGGRILQRKAQHLMGYREG